VLLNRRALALSVAVLVAGGGLAYSQLGVGRRKKRVQSQPAANGNSLEVSKGKDSAAVPRSKSKKRAKRGGLKSLKILGSILLAQMGKPGMQNLLGLAAFAVR
jgi:hypothetical protein